MLICIIIYATQAHSSSSSSHLKQDRHYTRTLFETLYIHALREGIVTVPPSAVTDQPSTPTTTMNVLKLVQDLFQTRSDVVTALQQILTQQDNIIRSYYQLIKVSTVTLSLVVMKYIMILTLRLIYYLIWIELSLFLLHCFNIISLSLSLSLLTVGCWLWLGKWWIQTTGNAATTSIRGHRSVSRPSAGQSGEIIFYSRTK